MVRTINNKEDNDINSPIHPVGTVVRLLYDPYIWFCIDAIRKHPSRDVLMYSRDK